MRSYKKRYHYGKETKGRKEEDCQEGKEVFSPPRLIAQTKTASPREAVFVMMRR